MSKKADKITFSCRDQKPLQRRQRRRKAPEALDREFVQLQIL